LSARDIKWSMIDTNEILIRDHKERAGLQVADVIAGAFYQAVERNRGEAENCDPSYARLLRPLIALSGKGKILGYGIKTMPNLWEMDLLTEQRASLEFYGYSQSGWRKVGRPLAPEPTAF
jgi:hypothetical protein